MPCRVIAEVLIDLFSGELQLFIDWDSLHSHSKPENVNDWRESFLVKWSRYVALPKFDQDGQSDSTLTKMYHQIWKDRQISPLLQQTLLVFLSFYMKVMHTTPHLTRKTNRLHASAKTRRTTQFWGGQKCWQKVCVCVCVREREREREKEPSIVPAVKIAGIQFEHLWQESEFWVQWRETQCNHPFAVVPCTIWLVVYLQGSVHLQKIHTQIEKKMHDCISQGIWYCATSLISLFLSSTTLAAAMQLRCRKSIPLGFCAESIQCNGNEWIPSLALPCWCVCGLLRQSQTRADAGLLVFGNSKLCRIQDWAPITWHFASMPPLCSCSKKQNTHTKKYLS